MNAYLPIRIVSAANAREHWAVRGKRTKGERIAARLAVQAAPRFKAIRLPVVVTLTRIAPRALDDDNLASGFKGIRDGVADAIGIDDGDDRIRWFYGQQKGKEYGITITIRSKK